MFDSHAGADFVSDVNKYCDLMSKLGQEFEDRFKDFDKLEPCVAFIANPFMEVDITEISEKMAELFTVNPVEMEMEVINLQNHVQLKSQQHSTFLEPCRPRKLEEHSPSSTHTISGLFGSTYLFEAAFSDMNVITSKFRTRLTDEHLNDCIRVNLSAYTPAYTSLVDSMQCQSSH